MKSIPPTACSLPPNAMARTTRPFGLSVESSLYFSGRLLAALEPVLSKPLTVVEAPAGYGKSVAVIGFLLARTERVLVSAAKQNSPETFWADFCRGLSQTLAQTLPEAGSISAQLAGLGFPRDHAQNRAARDLLGKLVFSQPTFLVFDDCHLLPHSFFDLCQSLAIARDAPPNLRLVCITRPGWTPNRDAAPPPTAQAYLDRHVFTLTAAEIAELYAQSGLDLDAEALQQALTMTGGWITALRLSLLWYKRYGEFSLFPRDTAARIDELIYTSLSPEAKDLLFALTPLQRFSAGHANVSLGRDASAVLDELCRKNAFVSYDPVSQTYSLHAIFRQFLLDRFNDDQVLPPERRREIYRACGHLLKQTGDLAAAVAAWHQAGDFDSALAALEENLTRNMVTENAALYVAMFKDCPDEILERHLGASFKYALAAFSAGDFAAFATRMAWLARQCAKLPPGREAQRWQGELEVLRALTAFNDITAMSGHHQKALALLGDQPTSLYGHDSPWTLGSPSVLFMFYRTGATLQETVRQMHECMPPYYQLTDYHGAGAELLLEAEALYQTGEFAQAEQLGQTALDVAVLRNQRGNEICALFLLMRLALPVGNSLALFGEQGKSGLLTDLRGLITRGKNYFLLHTADLCEGWLYATLGQYRKIPDWLRHDLGLGMGLGSPLYSFAKGFFPLVHGRALLLNKDYQRVIQLFRQDLQQGTYQKTLLFSVYAHIYLAAALSAVKQTQAGAASLQEALNIALPDNLLLPFVENYDLIGPLLNKIPPDPKQRQSLAKIQALAQQFEQGRASILQTLLVADLPGLLSERELQVAKLVVQGLPNLDIAHSLGITERTVKAHLTSIFRKTGVQSRFGLHKIFASAFSD